MSNAFIEALDVLTLRGNRLFGDPGSWGEAQMPPPPSVLAGALRSHLLACDGADFTAFADGCHAHPLLGTPAQPGAFVLADCTLARRTADAVQTLHPLPADLLAVGAGVQALRPLAPPLAGSWALPRVPVLAQGQRSKTAGGRWLSAQGLRRWMAGELPQPGDLVDAASLWSEEPRVGVALDAASGRADDGKLFSLQAIAMHPGVGFAVRVPATPLPAGVLRLGGDGRGARIEPLDIAWPEPDWDAIAAAGRARLLLTSPGLFASGWLPTGAGEADATQGACFELHGVRARIVCAALARAQTVSGFDLASRHPKPAQRAVPAGAVYWLADLQATPQALRKLAEQGLWPENADDPGMDRARRAEGYNRCSFGAWA
jgi:CRISPR-associated protein Cmr3